MDRRRFIRVLAAGAGLAVGPLLQACRALDRPASSPMRPAAPRAAVTRPPVPPPDPPSPRAAVALVATTDRASGVRRAIELLGPTVLAGRPVLLKPNLNSADPAPGSTHPDVLRALLAWLADTGAGPVTLGERSGMGTTADVMRATGALDLANEFGALTLAFDDLADDQWQVLTDPRFAWSRGFPVPRRLLAAGAVVQTCNLKTHAHGGHFTLSLKNGVGFVARRHGGHDYMDELHASPHQRRMIAEVNTAYQPALVVLDGVQAFVRGGPATGALADVGVVLAGTDRVALDAVGVALLRLHGTTPEVSAGPVFAQEQIARAVELGLGVASADAIELAVPDAASAAVADRIRSVLTA